MNAVQFSGKSRAKRRKVSFKSSTALTLTPMLDMLTVVLIFLIVNFSPEKAALQQGQRSPQVQLPKSDIELNQLPKLQIEVTKDFVKLNGHKIEGLIPATAEAQAWDVLKQELTKLASLEQDKTILLVADKDASYELVDRTVAQLASYGFGDVTLLTMKEMN